MIKNVHNLYSFLGLTPGELDSITSRITENYYQRSRPKIKYGEFQRDDSGHIKYRDLLIPSYILKSRQQRIARLLSGIILPVYMFGSIKERSNIQNARQHLNHQYFFTLDLKKFFPNINHHQVNKMLCRNGFSFSVSRILTQLTTYQASLPQGAPSSPVIANLVFMPTGNRLNELAKMNKIIFTTFLDDLTFSSDHCFKKLIPEIIKIVKLGGFYPAYDKMHYRKGYSEVTGLFVKGDRLELPYSMNKKTRENHHIKSYKEQVRKYNSVSPCLIKHCKKDLRLFEANKKGHRLVTLAPLQNLPTGGL